MRKTSIINGCAWGALALAVVLSATAIVAAQDNGQTRGGGGRPGGPGVLPCNPAALAHALKITPEQQPAFARIMKQEHTASAPLLEQLRGLEQSARGSGRDSDVARDALPKIRAISGQLADIRKEAHAGLAQILTEEQRTYLRGIEPPAGAGRRGRSGNPNAAGRGRPGGPLGGC